MAHQGVGRRKRKRINLSIRQQKQRKVNDAMKSDILKNIVTITGGPSARQIDRKDKELAKYFDTLTIKGKRFYNTILENIEETHKQASV